MSDTLPAGFNDLTPTELFRSALEDFALPVDEADKNKKKVLLAAFAEGGVSWSDYVAQHPEVKPQPENVITSPTVPGEGQPVPQEKPQPKPGKIITAEKPKVNPEDRYLIKMVRPNVRFDTRGYTFTKEHPYALVSANDADYILEKEEGFQMASPAELREYYG
jgi:hypothetical protein